MGRRVTKERNAGIVLTEKELGLVGATMEYYADCIEREMRIPTTDELSDTLKTTQRAGRRIAAYVAESGVPGLHKKIKKQAVALRQERLKAGGALARLVKETRFKTTEDYLLSENTRLTRAVEKARLDSANFRKVARALGQRSAGFDELKDQIPELRRQLPEIRFSPEVVKKQRPRASAPVREGHSEDAVFVVGDWHAGDVIRHEDTSGFPEYDIVVCANRVHYVTKKVKQILSLHSAMYPIKKLIVPILGDMGSGEIHDLTISNQLLAMPQIHFTYVLLGMMIDDLLTLRRQGIIEEIELLFSLGNHMRTSKYPAIKLQAQRSMDWLIYQFIIDKYKNTEGIKIVEDTTPFLFHDIRGHRYCFTHGSSVHYVNSPDKQIKGFEDFINHVRALFDSPEHRRRSGLLGATFDRIVIANVHVPVWFPRVVSNGSLNGQNELGVSWTLEPIPPQQWLFGVSKSHLSTWFYPLECGKIQREGDNAYKRFAEYYARRFAR